MGSDLSTPGPNQKDPPTPSTVRSFADDLPASTRSPPIDDARENDVRGGRLGRFLSDAMPTTKTTSKLPIPQEIHVVKEGSNEVPTIEQDADMRHMMSLPPFLPLVKGSVNLPSVRDPEVADRLDYRKILMVGLRYQQYLRQLSDIITVEQQTVMTRIREVDQNLLREVASLSEKQKLLARYSETFGGVAEISKSLDKINNNLEKTVDVMASLNQQLPTEYRLPPFSLYEK